MLFTYQDFMDVMKEAGTAAAVSEAIGHHVSSNEYKTACTADLYDKQLNPTIRDFIKWMYTASGARIRDSFSSNLHMASNAFHRLNTQRTAYSLGNGVSFVNDGTKEALGLDFDRVMFDIGYFANTHGVSFGYWVADRLVCFRLTEFVPLWDDENGSLMAGVRFWQIDKDKPMTAILYEIDGYTKLRADNETGAFSVIEEKRGYKTVLEQIGEMAEEVIGEENYSGLPIIPFYGSSQRQSTLIGLRSHIDAEDLVRNGFANDVVDCAQIYWVVNNAAGMTRNDLEKFLDQMKTMHIVSTGDNGATVNPYTQEVPFNARVACLADIKKAMYDGFGAIDRETITAGTTNDHIAAAYQPMDENADEFEYQLTLGIRALLALIGIEDTPEFKRNQISNEVERTNMILASASYLDDETVLRKLPFIYPEEIDDILTKRDSSDYQRFTDEDDEEDEEEAESANNGSEETAGADDE